MHPTVAHDSGKASRQYKSLDLVMISLASAMSSEAQSMIGWTTLAILAAASAAYATHRRKQPLPWDKLVSNRRKEAGVLSVETRDDETTVFDAGETAGATLAHISVSDLSAPLWRGLNAQTQTWVTPPVGGVGMSASNPHRLVAVVAPVEATQGLIASFCGFSIAPDQQFVACEPGWPSAIQYYPTLSFASESHCQLSIGIVAVLDDGDGQKEATRARRETLSRAVKAHCNAAILFCTDLSDAWLVICRLHAMARPPPSSPPAVRKGRSPINGSILPDDDQVEGLMRQGGHVCRGLELIHVVTVMPEEEYESGRGNWKKWEESALHRLMADEEMPKAMHADSGSGWFWERERVRELNGLRKEIRNTCRVRVRAVGAGALQHGGEWSQGMVSLRQELMGFLLHDLGAWDATAEEHFYNSLGRCRFKYEEEGGGSRLVWFAKNTGDSDNECEEDYGAVDGDWNGGGSVMV